MASCVRPSNGDALECKGQAIGNAHRGGFSKDKAPQMTSETADACKCKFNPKQCETEQRDHGSPAPKLLVVKDSVSPQPYRPDHARSFDICGSTHGFDMRLKRPFAISAACILALVSAKSSAYARDDGRYANSPLKPWFDQLKSGKGPCCSDADGTAVSDVDWETHDGHYRVRLDNQWIDVPDDAVITEPNRAGRTMVWPIRGYMGTTIRCFMPGSMT
jgi:hypothetical protein